MDVPWRSWKEMIWVSKHEEGRSQSKDLVFSWKRLSQYSASEKEGALFEEVISVKSSLVAYPRLH